MWSQRLVTEAGCGSTLVPHPASEPPHPLVRAAAFQPQLTVTSPGAHGRAMAEAAAEPAYGRYSSSQKSGPPEDA